MLQELVQAKLRQPVPVRSSEPALEVTGTDSELLPACPELAVLNGKRSAKASAPKHLRHSFSYSSPVRFDKILRFSYSSKSQILQR